MALALARLGIDSLGDPELVAPSLLWSECRSVLHEAVWRRELDPGRADRAREFLASGALREATHPDLGQAAWDLADQLGWAKTYDAEYVALAGLLGCQFVTLDAALYRGARRLGFVVSPADLGVE